MNGDKKMMVKKDFKIKRMKNLIFGVFLVGIILMVVGGVVGQENLNCDNDYKINPSCWDPTSDHNSELTIEDLKKDLPRAIKVFGKKDDASTGLSPELRRKLFEEQIRIKIGNQNTELGLGEGVDLSNFEIDDTGIKKSESNEYLIKFENLDSYIERIEIFEVQGKNIVKFTHKLLGEIVLDESFHLFNFKEEVKKFLQKLMESKASASDYPQRAGGAVGKGAEQAVQAAIQMGQQMAGIFEALKPKPGQGKTKVGVYENGVIAAEFSEGAEGTFIEDGKGKMHVAQKDLEKSATVEEGDEEREVKIKNAMGVVDGIAFSVEQPTEFTLNGNENNDPSNPPQTEPSTPAILTSFLPLLKSLFILPSITAQAITGQATTQEQGQYVKLIQHDIDISGREIIIDTLKTFNKIQAGGQNLDVYSGNIQIQFQGQRTYYPRLVHNAPYGIAQLENKLDTKNEFRLQHYTNRKSQFVDSNERVSSSDVVVKHPKKDLIVSKIRKEMWKS